MSIYMKRLRCLARSWWRYLSTGGQSSWDGHCWQSYNMGVLCIDCGKIERFDDLKGAVK